MDIQDIYFPLHLCSLALALCGIVYADHAAFNWLRGKTPTLSHRALRVTHFTVTLGLAGLVATGLLMFWPIHAYLLRQPLFVLKMCFVVSLILNSFVIEMVMHTAERAPFASLTTQERIPLFVSGAISSLCWLGAAVAALALFGLAPLQSLT